MTVSLLLVAFANEDELQGKIAMYILQETCPVLHRRIDRVRGKRNVEAGVETIVGEKWSKSCRCVQRVVVGELGNWEKVNPIVLLVTTRAPQSLFQDLVNPLFLSIGLRMIGWRQIHSTTDFSEKAPPKIGNEFGSCQTTFLKNKSAVSSPVMVLAHGAKWAILVKRLTITNTES